MDAFWEGTGGALIGAALSGIVAVFAVVWTRRDERALMREQMSLTAAHELLGFARDMRRRIGPFIHKQNPNARIDWDAVAQFVATAEADGERIGAYTSVIRPMRIADHVDRVWDGLYGVQDTLTPEVLNKRDRDTLDYVARDLGQLLTNLTEELNQYLRADLERREVASRPVWRRFKIAKRPPFVRRARLYEVVERDEYGSPNADY